MKIIRFNVSARRRGLTWSAAAVVAGLLVTVYTFFVVNTRAGTDDARMNSIFADGASVNDREALGALVQQGNFRVTLDTMIELIDTGLFDPLGDSSLEIGTTAPEFELMPLRFYDFAIDRGITQDNAGTLFEPVKLGDFKGSLPVVLIFGSYTWKPFRDGIGALNELARRYEGQARFIVIYIKEARLTDDVPGRDDAELPPIEDPVDFYERTLVANTCMSDLGIDIPCLIDDMENTAARAYKGWPARQYVIGMNGNVAWVGEPGPFGFRPRALEAALKVELAQSKGQFRQK